MNIRSYFGWSEDPRTYSKDCDLVLPSCLVGVEVELENAMDVRVPPLWTAVPDGSLRDHGIEFIFSNPLFGTDVEAALNNLHESCLPFKDSISLSYRTSVHVHVNVRDMDFSQLYHMTVLYTILERVLFKYAGEHRANNFYCMPFYRADMHMMDLSSLLNGQYQEAVGHMNKYSAFNLTSVGDKGSVEFRHMAGTWDKDKIHKWINILLSIKKYAVENECNPDALMFTVSAKGPEQFLESIFREDLLKELTYRGISDDIMLGVRLAQDIIFGMEAFNTSKETRRTLDSSDEEIKKFVLMNDGAVAEAPAKVEELKDLYAIPYEVHNVEIVHDVWAGGNAGPLQFNLAEVDNARRILDERMQEMLNRMNLGEN